MDYRQHQARIPLLLANRRQNSDAAVLDLKNCLDRIAIFVLNLNAMQPFDPSFIHCIGYRVIAISSQAIHTSSYEKMCAKKLRYLLSAGRGWNLGVICP